MTMLYDHRGQAVRRVSPTQTLGAPGTAIYAGYVETREKDRELASHDSRYRIYADILSNTSIVASGIRYYADLIGGATWTLTAAETDLDGMYSDLAEAALMMDGDTPWNRVVRRAAMYRFYGFSVQEWTAMRGTDGWFHYADIAPRAQHTIERWIQGAHGELLACEQTLPTTSRSVLLPREKILYIVDDTLSDSPEGLGLFRHLVSPAKRLERYEQLEGFGFETDLRGIPVLEAPLSELETQLDTDGNPLSKAQKDAMVKPLRDFAENHVRTVKTGLLLDSDIYRGEGLSESVSAVKKWAVNLVQGDSQSFTDNANAIERLNREMARIMGVEQLLLGTGEGSYALSKDKTHRFYLMVKNALNDIRQAVEKDLLLRLWQLNGWPSEMMPELAVEEVAYRDVEQIARTLRDMATAGAILEPDDPVIAEVRDLMGVSAPDAVIGAARADMGDDEGMEGIAE